MTQGGVSRTYTFSFSWGRRSAFVHVEQMPEADREADWDFAWYEVERRDGYWRGIRRLASRISDEPWTPQSPPHAETGGRVARAAPAASAPAGYPGDGADPA
jgi:hypothetical protein